LFILLFVLLLQSLLLVLTLSHVGLLRAVSIHTQILGINRRFTLLHYINHGISGTERVKQEDWVAEAALSEPALRVVHQQRVPVVHGIHGTISPLRV